MEEVKKILHNKKILICFGTRPEYIKVKYFIDTFNNIKTCFTGQHSLLKNIKVDYQLGIGNNIENRYNNILSNVIKYSYIFEDIDYVLIQGDTVSTFSIAISAFHNKIKIIHLEAGLRTYQKTPFPEEGYRNMISRITDIHLCYYDFHKKNLISENIKDNIYVIGNVSLKYLDNKKLSDNKLIIVTLHRNENIPIIEKWFSEIEKISNIFKDYQFILPIHPNPLIYKHKNVLKRVQVIDSLEYNTMIKLLKICCLVISDSGGLQEETHYFNKKIIVCRENTERDLNYYNNITLCKNYKDLLGLVTEILL